MAFSRRAALPGVFGRITRSAPQYSRLPTRRLARLFPVVSRGGSWNSPPPLCRSARRRWNKPDFRNDNMGFRVVCSSARPIAPLSREKR
ncbi:MAG: SUMF1/EgtB/PvdO family nonheme iron enzyme [Synechococcus sp.]